MIFWLDAQLPPKLASWIRKRFQVECFSVRDLKLRDAEDVHIFKAAKAAEAIIISKDKDFVEMVLSKGSPPQVLWVTCGNRSNAKLQKIFEHTFLRALELLQSGESIVEIED